MYCLHKGIVHFLFSLHFQTKDSNMCVHAHLWLPNDGDRSRAVGSNLVAELWV